MNRRNLMEEKGPARTAQLRRAAILVLRTLGVVIMTGLVAAGSVSGWQWMHRGERFSLKNVTFIGVHRANEDDLIRRAGLVRGQNLYSVNTAQAAAAMERADWVGRVRVERSIPDTVVVTVEEREPIAVVAAGPLFAIDGLGVRIKTVAAGDKLDLPVLTGLTADDFGGAGRDASPGALAALKVLTAYQSDRMGQVAPLSELHVADEGGETVYVAYCGDDMAVVEVVLGAFPSDPATGMQPVLARFERMWTELGREGRHARSIDLGNRKRPEWVPTRLEPQLAVRSNGAR